MVSGGPWTTTPPGRLHRAVALGLETTAVRNESRRERRAESWRQRAETMSPVNFVLVLEYCFGRTHRPRPHAVPRQRPLRPVWPGHLTPLALAAPAG